ncbi:MAG: nicotinate-nucleotide diphosphorylase [Acidimicrobiia bacterium]
MAVADPHRAAVRDAVARALAEDLVPLGDLTSALLPVDARAVADVVARVEGVVAGTACVEETFAQLDAAVEVAWSVVDGDRIGAGQVLGTVTGPMAPVLSGERTALNFLCHLSGVASATRRFVDAAAAGGPARCGDPRKSLPGLRTLE